MESTSNPVVVGISACLLGHEVRFDGGHKRDSYITGTLSQFFEFLPLCPEAAVNLGVPRPPIRLTKSKGGIRAVGVKDPTLDPTDDLASYGREQAAALSQMSGFILKNNSPSCGMERVKVYNDQGMPERIGQGIFAQQLMSALPLLPVEEEGRLGDPALRENFIERVFVYKRWQSLIAGGIRANAIVEFHSDHKYSLLAHDQATYRELGRLVSDVGNADSLTDFANEYISVFMNALKKRATAGQHVNVLQHLMGYLKDHLDAEDRAELLETISNYGEGLLPLIVPITLLKHHFRRHPHPYIERQHYLNPHPKELMLRNVI